VTSAFTTGKLYLEEPGNGDYVDTWDGPLNSNFSAVAAGSANVTTINLASTGSVTLTNGSTYPYNNLAINLTGSIGTGVTVSIPNTIGGFWVVYNNTNQTVTIQAVTPSVTAPITAGYKTMIWADGSGNVRSMDAVGFLPLSGGTMSGNITISNTNNIFSLTDTDGYPFSLRNNSNVCGIWRDTAAAWAFNTDTSGNLTATGNVTAYSDVRFKKDIKTIDRGLSIVEKLRGVRYRRRDNDQANIGVIAQEVQQVLPELVMTGESGKLSVAYGNLTAVLIEAVKELNDTVKTLQAKVEELEKKG
jgi:hypothetical protein